MKFYSCTIYTEAKIIICLFTLIQLESLDLDASGKSELSVSRSSSLIANLSGFDDEDTDSHDMNIVVDDPEKHSGTMDSYVTFRISLRVNIPVPLLNFINFSKYSNWYIYVCMTSDSHALCF